MILLSINSLKIRELNCFIFALHTRLFQAKRAGLKYCAEHVVWDCFPKIGTTQKQDQFHACLHFHFSKHLIRKISSSDSLLNVLEM